MPFCLTFIFASLLTGTLTTTDTTLNSSAFETINVTTAKTPVSPLGPADSTNATLSGITTHDKALYQCDSCNAHLGHHGPTTTQAVWVQIKVKVESSDQEGSNKDERVVKELYSAPGSETNPPKVRLRNPLFYFQSPCSVAQVESTGATVLSQVACESNQNFECHKNPKSPERWNAEKINWENGSHSETCKMHDVCWSKNETEPEPGCRSKPLPGTLHVSSDFYGDRIIGGEEANIEDHPWAVFLYVTKDDKYWKCGASIIGKHLILTARHCIISERNNLDLRKNHWQFMLGQVDNHRLPPIMSPSDYNFILHPNKWIDIALIKLRKPIKFSTRVAPLSLPESTNQKPEDGEWATAIGWGVYIQLSENEFYESSVLRTVNVPVLGSKCRLLNQKDAIDVEEKPYLFCAGGPIGPDGNKVNKDTCSGDSGGSLVCTDQNKKYVCGVTSKGPHPPYCARAAGGYAMTSHPEVLPFLKRELDQQRRWTGGVGEASSRKEDGVPKPGKAEKDRGGSKMQSASELKAVINLYIPLLSLITKTVKLFQS